MPATNLYFNNYSNAEEQTLLENLIIESIKIYGIECYYMPRTLVGEDNIFGEDPLSKFEQAYNIEMYIKSVDGFEGEGDFLSKFNIEIRDEITFVVARRRFADEVDVTQTTPVNEDNGLARPAEGDLIYFPLNGKIFEVKFVEHESVFYQLGDLQTYELRCELFEYSYEEIDTGITTIDATTLAVVGDAILFGIKAESFNPVARGKAVMGNTHQVTTIDITEAGLYDIPPEVTISPPPTAIQAQAVAYIDYALRGTVGLNVIENGRAYETPPSVSISSPPTRFAKFGDNSLSSEDIGINIETDVVSINGDLEFWLYPSSMPNTSTFSTVLTTGNTVYGFFSNGDLGYIPTGDNANTSPTHLVTNTGIFTTIQQNLWNKVKLTTDGDGSTTTLKTRINGILTSVTSGFTNTMPMALGGQVRTGGQTISAATNSTFTMTPFSGYLDDLYINSTPTDFIGTVEVVKGIAKSSSLNGTLLYEDFNNVQARATANLLNGTVESLNLINAGKGYYTTAPTITINHPGKARTANATAILFVGGGVDRVRMEDMGSGYVTPPTITFDTEQPELPFFLLSEESEYIILEEYQEANTAGAKNAAFQLEAEGKAEESDFIDFSEFNPFSEKGTW
jgi:hypothetical protein